jgi:hypothetical protein
MAEIRSEPWSGQADDVRKEGFLQPRRGPRAGIVGIMAENLVDHHACAWENPFGWRILAGQRPEGVLGQAATSGMGLLGWRPSGRGQ